MKFKQNPPPIFRDSPLDGPQHRSIDDAGQHADGVGPVQILGAVHVLRQARRYWSKAGNVACTCGQRLEE